MMTVITILLCAVPRAAASTNDHASVAVGLSIHAACDCFIHAALQTKPGRLEGGTPDRLMNHLVIALAERKQTF